jgi:DNA polymerase III alpha subunit
MEQISIHLIQGMVKNGIEQEVASRIYKQLTAFADYGFPESHAASFALLVYISAYLKVFFPQEFYCSLLNAQPMGFYSPATIIHEGQRRGVEFLGVDVSRSGWDCTVEDGRVRLGLRTVKGLGPGAKVVFERESARGSFVSLENFVFRTGFKEGALSQLAMVGAFNCFGFSRRQALWEVMLLAGKEPGELSLRTVGKGEGLLPSLTPTERLIEDFKGQDLSVGPNLMAFVRAQLSRQGIKSSADLHRENNATAVSVAGIVIIRQKPGTAKGFLFLTLEDETGFINIVVRPKVAERFRKLVHQAEALVVAGRLERKDSVINVVGERFQALDFALADLRLKSRDFR